MGLDKALMPVGGVSLAARLGRLLANVARPALEVGPGASGLAAVQEDRPGEGPLSAVAAGAQELRRLGHPGPALVLACDLPLLGPRVLDVLASWPGDRTVMPYLAGRDQPLCARWSAADLDGAAELAAAGQRSLRWLSESAGLVRLDESFWRAVADPREMSDADTPEDLARLGLAEAARSALTGTWADEGLKR